MSAVGSESQPTLPDQTRPRPTGQGRESRVGSVGFVGQKKIRLEVRPGPTFPTGRFWSGRVESRVGRGGEKRKRKTQRYTRRNRKSRPRSGRVGFYNPDPTRPKSDHRDRSTASLRQAIAEKEIARNDNRRGGREDRRQCLPYCWQVPILRSKSLLLRDLLFASSFRLRIYVIYRPNNGRGAFLPVVCRRVLAA